MRTVSGCLLALALVAVAASEAHARWFVGVRIGVPIYAGPYCYGYYRPYPYGVYVAPPPVIVAPPPVVQAVPAAPVPVPAYSSPAANAGPEQLPAAPVPIARGVPPAAGASAWDDLNSTEERARADAIIQLGRRKDRRAVGPLTRALREDRSPTVREAAARGLGLIGAPASLNALQHAAQADDDRDVRRSASFAADVIRANLGR
jgi:hypothetical protein